MEPLLVPDDLDSHQTSRPMIDASDYLAETAFPEYIYNFVAVSEVVAPRERTAVFGRLQGSIMLGTAFGYPRECNLPLC